MEREEASVDLQRELRAMRAELSAMRRRERRTRAIQLVAALVIALPTLAWAAQITLPNTFANGTAADANEVNANFDALATESNDQDTRLSSLEGATGVTLTDCVLNDFANTYNATFNYICPAGQVMTGVYSVHDNGQEDRIFRFRCCSIEPN